MSSIVSSIREHLASIWLEVAPVPQPVSSTRAPGRMEGADVGEQRRLGLGAGEPDRSSPDLS